MNPKHLRQELVTAYEGHDRHAFDAALNRMEAMFAYTGPVPQAKNTAEAAPNEIANATFAGSLHCTKTEACDCKSWPQAKTCMHRRSP